MADVWTYDGHEVEFIEPRGPLFIDGENVTQHFVGTTYSRDDVRKWIDEELGDGSSDSGRPASEVFSTA